MSASEQTNAVEPAGAVARRRAVGRENLHGLGRMIAGRLLTIVATTFGVTFVVFALAAASPFDPLAHHLGASYGRHTAAERAEIAASLGLDNPWWQQFLHWWASALQGDFGFSRVYNKPVAQVFAERLPWTALLSGVGLALMLVLALVLSLMSVRKPGGAVDRGVSALAVVLAATPSYVYALGTILIFGVIWHVIPLGGAAPVGQQPSLGSIGPFLIAPAVVLALSQLSWPILAMQEAAAQAANSPAVACARFRGLSQRTVVRGHILPMSLMPLVMLLGARLGELVVGAVIVENVFSWPGLAQATVEAAIAVDFPLLALVTAATTILVMLGSLASDITQLLVDPRVSDV